MFTCVCECPQWLEVTELLEPELQGVVSHSSWMLRTKLQSSANTVSPVTRKGLLSSMMHHGKEAEAVEEPIHSRRAELQEYMLQLSSVSPLGQLGVSVAGWCHTLGVSLPTTIYVNTRSSPRIA